MSKVWDDQSNLYGTRPGSIDVTLYSDANGTTQALVAPQPVEVWTQPTGSDTWTYKYLSLPKYKIVSGLEVPIMYTVKETPKPGYTPSTISTVTGVVDTTTGNVSEANFTNYYFAAGSLSLSGTKYFKGRDTTQFDVFRFRLYEGSVAPGNLLDTQEVTGSGSFTFKQIPYKLDFQPEPAINDIGPHTYVVTEDRPFANPSGGITYAIRQHTVTVNVTHSGLGTLGVEVTSQNADC